MANYILIGSSSIVQVLTPKVTEEMVAVTIRTKPTGVTATALVSQVSFDNSEAAATLTAFSGAIEELIGQGKAVGAVGAPALDRSGLQSYSVVFEVAYNPPGAPSGTVTVDVDVPVGLLTVDDPELRQPLLDEAAAIIDKAYGNLVALSQG